MNIEITFDTAPSTSADTVIAPIYKDNALSPAAQELDKEIGGLIEHVLDGNTKFTGKAGQVTSVTAPKKSGFKRVLLLGLGDPEKIDGSSAETIGGKLFLALQASGAKSAALHFTGERKSNDLEAHAVLARILMGLKLRSYSFDKYKTKKEDSDDEPEAKLEKLLAVSADARDAENLYDTYKRIADGVFFARDLVNEPPNELYPDSFAEIIREELKPLGVEIEIFDEKKMEKLGFHSHLAVGKGSERQPRVVIMRWKGDKKKDAKPLAFVGKGVTFDTGGVNLKPSGGMEEMKLDMGGAAAVVGLMKSLALRKSKAHVVGIVGLAENMPSHNAYRPSDIIDCLAGKKIEVMNTDAEGRLVLADCMTYVQRTYEPELVIDLATLTGAMMVALGHEYCGTFVNNDDLWNKLEAASREGCEKLWRMPLDAEYKKEMNSQIADLKTLGNGRYGGACTAAGFLENFVEGDTPWAHMDIAGTAWVKKDLPTCPKPGTGFGVRVLDRLVAGNYE